MPREKEPQTLEELYAEKEKTEAEIHRLKHMGTAATAMERKGIRTDLGNLNREIQRLNRMLKAICQSIKELKTGLIEIRQKQQEWKAEKAAEAETQLPLLLMKYVDIRKDERKNWNRCGREHGTAQDLKMCRRLLCSAAAGSLHCG